MRKHTSLRGAAHRDPTVRSAQSGPPAGLCRISMRAPLDGRAVGGAQCGDRTTCEEPSRDCVVGCSEYREHH
eukprot:2208731-Pyramimonas_sp.AAC.1